jgi:hypothetical protein
MSCQTVRDFCLDIGETFHPSIRWGTDVLISKPIGGITQAAPVVITALSHGVPNGWPVAVVSAQGMTQINATRYPPKGADWHKATVLTNDTISINDINSADYSPYTTGGFLVYSSPISLNGVTATMKIWDNPNETGTPLLTLTEIAGITLDSVNSTITPRFETTGITWNTGYYDLDITDADGIVTNVLTGTITIN